MKQGNTISLDKQKKHDSRRACHDVNTPSRVRRDGHPSFKTGCVGVAAPAAGGDIGNEWMIAAGDGEPGQRNVLDFVELLKCIFKAVFPRSRFQPTDRSCSSSKS